jgi:hypothetical protein
VIQRFEAQAGAVQMRSCGRLSGVISANLWVSFIAQPCLPCMQSSTNSLMPPAPVPVLCVKPRSVASSLHRSFPCSLASNLPGFSRMTQARRSGPCGRARQISANAGEENAADKPTSAKPILSIVSISVCLNAYPCAMN